MHDLRNEVPLRDHVCPICEDKVVACKEKAVSFLVGRSTSRTYIHTSCVKAMKTFLDSELAKEIPDEPA